MVVSLPTTMGAVVTPIHSDVATHLCWRERTMEWGCIFTCVSLCSIKWHCTFNPDASDGCHVGFAASECMAGENGCILDSCIVIVTKGL